MNQQLEYEIVRIHGNVYSLPFFDCETAEICYTVREFYTLNISVGKMRADFGNILMVTIWSSCGDYSIVAPSLDHRYKLRICP
ncbi:MAG: hypothetical protein WAL66_07050, partial [Nitrososphaeraceae archaeon]